MLIVFFSSPCSLFWPERRYFYLLNSFPPFNQTNSQVYVNEVVLGTVFGIFMGPYFADIFNPRSWGNESDAITLEVTRVVLATGLFAIGVELPKSYLAKHAKSLLAMVIPTMAIGWVIVAGAYFLFSFSMSIPGLNSVPVSRPPSCFVS